MGHSEYRLEPMAIEDYKGVVALWKKTEGVGLNESDSRSNIRGYLKRNPGMSYVVRDHERIVGAVLCGHDGRRGYLHHLAVARTHRGRGLGKALVDACLKSLSKAGVLKCTIFVFRDNGDGETFWKNQGWVKRDDLGMMQRLISTEQISCR